MSYTLRDTPEVVARVEGDLARVAEAVRARDPALRSLVLTGGFARGEGTVLDGVPQNDYDFVAVRRLGAPARYGPLARQLEAELGLHIDLAPVAAARLPRVAPSIFWYETALRGKTVWGEPLLDRIPVRGPQDLAPGEALRLVANRAAGLLLVTPNADPHARRIQAAKALLAALDAHLLGAGAFAPSQRERQELWARLPPIPAVEARRAWFEWAFAFKVDLAHAPPRDAAQAWRAARAALLDAVPTALRLAGPAGDGVVDHLLYLARSRGQAQARLLRHPTMKVRQATLRLLEATPEPAIAPADAVRILGPRAAPDPTAELARLRAATRQ
ncbi:MAG: hypothetical protein QOD77_728 [Thermoplasmata archaeon]|jgi:hypothetical protein|nr:hypothetical protein [Thermoplasmata archaeon]